MRLENAVAADVLERILSAYGFTMQKELSDKLGIAKSNVASWLQRGQVPGNVLVQCALDTGADIQWLVTGVFAKANIDKVQSVSHRPLLSGQKLINKMLSTGGRPVLQRVMDAYGFNTQKELSEYLGISTGTISTWVRRDYFPGDVVITCAIDTGISLEWLASGEGEKILSVAENSIIPRKIIKRGSIIDSGFFNFDLSVISHDFLEPAFVASSNMSWIVDFSVKDISNGSWIIGVNDKFDIYHVILLPGDKIKVKNNGFEFTCNICEISISAKVFMEMNYT